MARAKHIALWGALLVGVVALFEWTNLDLQVQDRLFNFEANGWMVDREAPLPRLLFYTGMKGGLIAFGVTTLVLYGLSFWKGGGDKAGLQSLRQRYLTVILALIVVPSTIAVLKAETNMYCPSQIERYGGDKPYVTLFEAYPARCRPCDSGRCFPAGHASGGFALMALYHMFRKKKNRVMGLFGGLGLGWTMGLYQMMKGAHFLSHTVVTMVASWVMILCVADVARRIHSTSEVGAPESGMGGERRAQAVTMETRRC
ncbi:hypothetical protein DSLASN_00600 [Desulfoluna limicola]|uniref:Phosphatidic acid phosphatase type 2/haloperoxidase domain-containing protein n=1 Tax=Desulfoluna limicola TaxID=2810562 RepID=A0ABN6EXS1_9BACT|nr:phosphatase PAP2 family protein [Desulfoluna limicola]BCS94428.1 hypothetical protein DSLASN_00600 [Desulfoluna limicola]